MHSTLFGLLEQLDDELDVESTQPVLVHRKIRRRQRRTGRRPFTVNEKVTDARVELVLGISFDDPPGPEEAQRLVELYEQRPKTRGDCEGGQRPCPWVSCRHHLALDVTESGSLYVIRDVAIENMKDTCVLDVVDRAESSPLEFDELGRFKNQRFAMTLEEVGETFNVTRERIRQLETKALAKVKALAHLAGIREDVASDGFTHPTYGEENYR